MAEASVSQASTMIFKVKYFVPGGHTHCSLYAAPRAGTTFAKCGDFVVRNEEFKALVIAMAGVSFEGSAI